MGIISRPILSNLIICYQATQMKMHGKHEYAYFENEQKKSNSGGWFNKSKVTPQSMSSDASPKPPKKASTHLPFLEHRQGPQDAYQFSGTAYGNPPSTPKKTTQRSRSTSSSSKWST